MKAAWEIHCRICFSSDHTLDFYTEHPNGLTRHTAPTMYGRLAFRCRISAPAQRSSEVDPSLLIFGTKGQVEHRLSAVKSCCPSPPHPPSVPVLTSADVDECLENRCHPSATCYNTPGSFSCRCQPGYHGDGLRCTPGKVWSSD